MSVSNVRRAASAARTDGPSPSTSVPAQAATRRQLLTTLTALGVGGLLVGCSASSTTPPTAAAPASTGGRTGTRQFVDQTGRTVQIPAEPRRVVILDPARAIVDAVALGVVPVGATSAPSNAGNGFPPLLGGAGEAIVDVGAIGQTSVERVATLDPDLILFATAYQEDLSLDTLSAIAPVVAYERPQFGLLEPLRFFGEALGRQDRAAELELDFVDRITERRSELGLDGRRVAVINMPGADASQVEVLGPDVGFSPVLNLLGATFAPPQLSGEDFTNVSVERLSSEFADVELVIGLQFLSAPEDDAVADAFTESALWNAVPAVAAGDVVFLDGQQAFVNYGLDGVEAALDDLANQLG